VVKNLQTSILYYHFICIKNYCQCRLYSLTWFLRVILDYDFTIEEIMFFRQNKKLSTGYPICLSLKSMRRIGRREKSVCVGRGEGRQRDTYCMLKVWDGRNRREKTLLPLKQLFRDIQYLLSTQRLTQHRTKHFVR